jgi:hypothetical protein
MYTHALLSSYQFDPRSSSIFILQRVFYPHSLYLNELHAPERLIHTLYLIPFLLHPDTTPKLLLQTSLLKNDRLTRPNSSSEHPCLRAADLTRPNHLLLEHPRALLESGRSTRPTNIFLLESGRSTRPNNIFFSA